MEVKFGNDWDLALQQEIQKPYFLNLMDKVDAEYASTQVFPPRELVFNAFQKTPLANVKVVILGQDPYHGEGMANGLSFSVNPGVKVPKSLVNIYKELSSDLGIKQASTGDLSKWAEQGVLLLNTALTVRAHEADSHKNLGWSQFIDTVLDVLNQSENPIVFLCWGRHAQKRCERITNSKHLVLHAAHPSPFSANNGFFGCKHFSKANDFLKNAGRDPIDWKID